MNHVQAGSYLAGDASLSIDTQFSGAKGMMSGEGPVLLAVQGRGLLLRSSFGAIHTKELGSGEENIVDTGHLVAFEATVQWRIEKATGATQSVVGFLEGIMKSALTGEGLVCRYAGPGKLYIQTRQFRSFARELISLMPKTSGG
jgi:uncharacterized protein (TIGR00266 family)